MKLAALVITFTASSDMADNMHVTPVHEVHGPHANEGFTCWCQPTVLQLCPECDDVPGPRGRPGCWRCDGEGKVPCEDPERYDGPHGLIIVHNINRPDGSPW